MPIPDPLRLPIRARAGSVVLLLASLVLPRHGVAAPYAISRWTVDGGGVSSQPVGAYVCGGTVGQPDAGLLTRLNYRLAGGFWGSMAPSVSGVADSTDGDPGSFPDIPGIRQARIEPPAPNPLRSQTRIAFLLPEPREVEIKIFDIHGSLVRVLAQGPRPAGRYTLEWNTRGEDGDRVGAGIYFVRVRLGTLEKSLKLVVMP